MSGRKKLRKLSTIIENERRTKNLPIWAIIIDDDIGTLQSFLYCAQRGEREREREREYVYSLCDEGKNAHLRARVT